MTKPHQPLAPNNRTLSSASALFWLAVAIPIVIHAVLLYRYSVNAPRLDDFSEVLTFLPNFYGASSWQEKLHAFFAVYQDHRYGVTHTLNLLTNGINFRHYTLWGNLLLPAYVFLCWIALRAHPMRRELILIATLLIFNLHTWFGMYWASILLTSLGSLPIALLTFILATSNNPRLQPLACISAICSTYTLGNGIFVWPILIAYFLLENKKQQKPLFDKRVLHWLAMALAITVFYFYDFNFFNKGGHGGTQFSDLLLGSIRNFPRLMAGYFILAGSHLQYYSGETDWKMVAAGAIGLLETMLLLFLVIRGSLRSYPALLLLLVFVGLTMLSIAFARVVTINLGQALQGHYKLYPSTYLFILFAAILDWAQKNKPQQAKKYVFGTAAIAASLFIAALFLFKTAIQEYHQQLADDVKQWLYSNTLQRGETQLFVKQPNKKLLRAVKAGFYNPWTLLDKPQLPLTTQAQTACQPITISLPAELKSQKNALAVHIAMHTATPVTSLLLCSPRQAMRIAISATQYQAEKNGTYSLELWVPRNKNITEDIGPWALYAQP